MAKKTTLADVAELANVAVGTASEALNNKPGISEATRARIREAARQLGYDQRFNLDARPDGKMKTVGVIKHEHHDYPGIDPFYAPVISGIERQCQQSKYMMLYGTADVDDHNRMTRLPHFLEGAKLDGLIIVGTCLSENLAKEIQKINCPVVMVDGYAERARFDRVLTNNLDGACDIVTHLIENGHRDIGLIGASQDPYPSIRARQEGYLMALFQAGIQDSYIEPGLLNREAAYNATLALLDRCPHITAIFAANDNAAFGVINAVHSLGRDVPRDLSVVGFDDIFFAQDMVPPLTTMSIDKVRMGELSVSLLEYRSRYPSAPVMTQILDARLVRRSSVRNLRS